MINDEISNEMVDILLKLDRNLGTPSIYGTVSLSFSLSLSFDINFRSQWRWYLVTSAWLKIFTWTVTTSR